MGAQTIYGQFASRSAGTATAGLPVGTDSAANGGTVAWSNPGNIGGTGNAQIISASGLTHWLLATAFFLRVPASATIIGVQLNAQQNLSGTAGPPSRLNMSLIKAGTPTGTSPTGQAVGIAGIAGFVQTPLIVGGPTDLWGTTLTPADVNDAGFGVALAFQLGSAGSVVISTVTLTVWYTLPDANGIILQDSTPNLGNGVQSEWTRGANIIAGVSSQPSLMAPWTVTGWSVRFLGQLVSFANAGGYGALGEVWGGLVLGSPTPTSPGPLQLPWASPMGPFPNDLSTFTKVWDGAQSAPFPRADGLSTQTATAGAPPRYSELTFPLPIPVTMQPGDQIGIGLWLTPALVFNTITQIRGASWSISYDDGVR